MPKRKLQTRKAKQVAEAQDESIRNAILIGVEFGFLLCEKGNNLDYALIEARKILTTNHRPSVAVSAARKRKT